MKTLKQIRTYALAAFTAVAILATGCKKEQMGSLTPGAETTDAARDANLVVPTGTGSLNMLMMSTPAKGLGVVQVNISSVQVHYTDKRIGRNGWLVISTASKGYNLQQYNNGEMVSIGGSKRMPLGTIDQVRLHIGDNNYVVWADEQGRHLSKLAVANPIGIANTQAVINRMDNRLQMLINFSAQSSVSNEGNGTFILDPKVTVVSTDTE